MSPQTFKASVQYDDFTGTAAADGSDSADAGKWLSEKNLIQDGEFLLGITLYVGALAASGDQYTSVEFLLAPIESHDKVQEELGSHSVPVVVRKVQQDVPLELFFSFFKRFKVCLSNHGMLEGREYTFPDY